MEGKKLAHLSYRLGKCKSFVKLLEIFYDVTLKFSASLTITSNVCFHELNAIFTKLTDLSKS